MDRPLSNFETKYVKAQQVSLLDKPPLERRIRGWVFQLNAVCDFEAGQHASSNAGDGEEARMLVVPTFASGSVKISL